MTRILWVAPNLNHYKARFLNRLATEHVDLTVLSGRELSEQGHRQATEVVNFRVVSVPVEKSNFQYRTVVYRRLASLIRELRPNAVLMPIEKKFSILIIYLALLRLFYRYRLFSYNHPVLKSQNPNALVLNKLVTKLFYKLYDRVIFYTEQTRDWAVEKKLLPSKKAFFANNTLDTKTIWENYELTINSAASKTILFIGRLIPSKRLALLLDYFLEIQKRMPGCKLKIIGDGPDRILVEKAAAENPRIEWLGVIVDELEISRHMTDAHIVFVPGHSGLSIVHAFCYGKPYITLGDYDFHPPELTYIENGVNGLILDRSHAENIVEIVDLLIDQARYSEMCRKAFDTAKSLSIENWCQQMRSAIQ